MSIEIEVGLENATKAPRITEEELGLEETPKGLANPKVQRVLIAGGAVVLAAIVGLFLYFQTARRRMMRRWTGISRRWRRKFTGAWHKSWWKTTSR